MEERADTGSRLGQPPHDASRSLLWHSNTGSNTTGSEHPLPENPADLLQGLVKQTQLLACLQWLGEFQILAYVPLSERVAYADLADLTGVSAAQIRRIVRTTATAGFLCEPQPDHVAHTPLSIQFVKRPSCLDAIMFMAETVAPSALHMAEAARRAARYQQTGASAFQIATNSSVSLAAACEKDAKLQRRAGAFQRLVAASKAAAVAQLLSTMDWEGLGQATVVEVNAASTATAKALSARNPGLRFVVQMREDVKQTDAASSAQHMGSSSQVQVIAQRRAPGTRQDEKDAAVYLLHIPDPFFCASSDAHAAVCVAELRTHFEVLGANSKGTLILIAEVLPDSYSSGGHSCSLQAEAAARLKDLLLLQMGHDEVFNTKRLIGLLEGVREDAGRLKIVNQLSSPDYPLLAYELCARE